MRGRNRTLPPERWIHPAASTRGSPGCRMNPAFHSRDGLAVLSVRIVTSREDFPSRMFFLPLPGPGGEGVFGCGFAALCLGGGARMRPLRKARKN
jgi:hypothetical protein